MVVERSSYPGFDGGAEKRVPFLHTDLILPMPALPPVEQSEELEKADREITISPETYAALEAEKPELIACCQRLGEQIISAEKVPLVFPDKLLPPDELLKQLAGYYSENGVDHYSMPVAAGVTPENAHDSRFNLFNAGFLRDAFVIAKPAIKKYPQILHSTLHFAASHQGVKFDAASEEEPGKEPHEHRRPDDPVGQRISREKGWKWDYYGAVDTTVDFIANVALYRSNWAATDSGEQDILEQVIQDDAGNPLRLPDGRIKTMRDAVQQAASWMIRRMSPTPDNPEGLLEFKRANPQGIENQAWKDSGDSYFHKDGTLANHEKGVSSIEIQMKAYNACLSLIQLFPEHTEYFAQEAQRIRGLIDTHFWTEDERGEFPVLGLDRDEHNTLRQLDILTSNAAYVVPLLTEEEDKPRRENLVRLLFSDEMWSSGGLRTVSSDEVRFHPDAYHNGSSWPFDTANFAHALDQVGLHELATVAYDKVIETVETTNLYPEKVSGDDGPAQSIDQWEVEVMAQDGSIRKTAQPPQLLQGFTLAAYIEALNRREAIKQGLFPSFATIPENRAFEQEIMSMLEARDRFKRQNEQIVVFSSREQAAD
jgi:glycogen debranching enzyme